MREQSIVAQQRKLQELYQALRPYEIASVARPAAEVNQRLLEVQPIVKEIIEALEALRKRENKYWPAVSYSYCEEYLVPQTDLSFDNAEEAEMLALVYGKAFLSWMNRMPEPMAWEDVRTARMLFLQMSNAFSESALHRKELVESEGA